MTSGYSALVELDWPTVDQYPFSAGQTISRLCATPIHDHAPRGDPPIDFAAGADTGVRENFLNALGQTQLDSDRGESGTT